VSKHISITRREFLKYSTSAALGVGIVASGLGCLRSGMYKTKREGSKKMGKVYVINVVHTEHNWWDDKYTGLDIGVRHFLQKIEKIENSEGIRIPITWCLSFANGGQNETMGVSPPDIIDMRKDFFVERFELGDEIGVHPHAADPRKQWKFIEENAKKIESEGFPYPKTHAPGWFYLDGKVFRELEKAGIEIDAGLLVGMKGSPMPHHEDIMQLDTSERSRDIPKSFRPYFPSYKNVTKPGECPILEIPVFMSYDGIADNPQGFIDATRVQWEHRDEVPVDIIQFYWHPHEFMKPKSDEIADEVVNGYYTVYKEIAAWKDIYFSTAQEAAKKWKNAYTKKS
jgi:hypothetical protein